MLNEASLDESAGVGGPANWSVIYRVPDEGDPIGDADGDGNWDDDGDGNAGARRAPADGPIDWDDDGVLEPGVHTEINDLIGSCSGGGDQSMAGSEDWSHLAYGFRDNVNFQQYTHETHTEVDFDPVVIAEAATAIDFDEDGLVNAFDNCPAVPNPDQADANGNGTGDACESVGGGVVSAPLTNGGDASDGRSGEAGAFARLIHLVPLLPAVAAAAWLTRRRVIHG
jgi:hypothetical protein